jgi:hypothetical protein
MNDPPESLPDELFDLLAPLRAVSVPDEARVANREAVRHALALRAWPPWWRRTVAVPVPIAVAATVMLAISMLAISSAALLWSASARHRADRTATGPMQDRFVETGAASKPGTDYAAGPAWSVTRSYIQSLESLSKTRFSLERDAKEKKDDS